MWLGSKRTAQMAYGVEMARELHVRCTVQDEMPGAGRPKLGSALSVLAPDLGDRLELIVGAKGPGGILKAVTRDG